MIFARSLFLPSHLTTTVVHLLPVHPTSTFATQHQLHFLILAKSSFITTANMKFVAFTSLAFISAVAAQNSTTAATGCVAKDNACRASDPVTGLSANQAECSSENAQCQGDCYAALITCQTTPGPDGSSANQAGCVGEYATCLGENPIAASGGIISSFIPYTASTSAMASSTSAAASASVTGSCVDKDNACRQPSPMFCRERSMPERLLRSIQHLQNHPWS
jgi:hypothetical protein